VATIGTIVVIGIYFFLDKQVPTLEQLPWHNFLDYLAMTRAELLRHAHLHRQQTKTPAQCRGLYQALNRTMRR
jgi:hypothetical protein